MHDPRFDRLAELLVNFSTALKKGEKALLDAFDIPPEMTIALVRAVRAAGAIPFVQIHQGQVNRELALGFVEEGLDVSSSLELARMKKMDAYIAVRGGANITEMSDVPPEQMRLIARKMKAVLDWRVKKTRWCVLRWPSPSMAQLAGMSTEAFEKFYFDVCTLNYARMVPGMKALKTLMDVTDKVEIRGPGTDLKFSIKNIAAIRINVSFGKEFQFLAYKFDPLSLRAVHIHDKGLYFLSIIVVNFINKFIDNCSLPTSRRAMKQYIRRLMYFVKVI